MASLFHLFLQLMVPANDLEGITQKTGSAKKFPVFVKMLLTALGSGSDSVFVDLLTYADLELLKAKRAGSDGYMGTSSATSASTPTNIQNNKRYLILTYAAEYDRVHYPLPLAFVERLDSIRSSVKAGLGIVSNGIATGAYRADGSPTAQTLRAENEELLQQVEDLMLKLSLAEAKANGAGSSGSNSGSGRGPVDSNIEVEDVDSPKCLRLRQMLEDMKVRFNNLQQAHEQLRVDSSTEIRKIRREAREAAKIATDKHAEAVAEAADKASALRDEVEEAEERLQEAETRHVQEVDKLKKELIKERVSGRAMREKLRECNGQKTVRDTSLTKKGYPPSRSTNRGTFSNGPSPGPWGSGSGFADTGNVSVSTTARGVPAGAGRRLSMKKLVLPVTPRVARTPRIATPRGTPAGSWGLATPTVTSGVVRGREEGHGFPEGRGASSGRHQATSRGRTVRRGYADSPSIVPTPRAFAKGSELLKGGDSARVGRPRVSSWDTSPTSSRGRSRSAGSTDRRRSKGPPPPAFDPTAYQRRKEAKLRRLEDERRDRERREIGYSPGRTSGRDSWIKLGGDQGADSSTARGTNRGRSRHRDGNSGYLSTGSQGSRASGASRASSGAPSRASSRSSRACSARSRASRSDRSQTYSPKPRPKKATISYSSKAQGRGRGRGRGFAAFTPRGRVLLNSNSRAPFNSTSMLPSSTAGPWAPSPARKRWYPGGNICLGGESRIRSYRFKSAPRSPRKHAKHTGKPSVAADVDGDRGQNGLLGTSSKVGGRITQDEGRMICVSSSTMRDSYKSSTASANEKSTDLNEPIEGGRGSESMGWAEMVHRLSQQKSEEAVGRDRSNSATMADGGTADTLEMSGRSDRYDSATRSHAVLPSSAGQTTSSSSPAFVHNGGVGSNHRKIAERDSLESSGGSGGSSSKRGERRKPSAGRISQEFAPSRTGDTLTSEQQQDKALGDSAWRWQRVQDGTQYHTKEESRQMPVVVDTGMSAGQPGIEVDAKVAADARSSSLVTSLARTRMMVSRGLHSQPTKADQQGKDAAGGKGEPESVVTGREISDIDRRLGELHEFLKRAKAGGVPLPPPSPNKIVQQPLSKHNGDGDRTNEEGGHSPFVRPSSFGPMSALSMGENGGHHNSSHDRPLLPTSRTPHQLSEHTVSTKTIDLVPPVDAARG